MSTRALIVAPALCVMLVACGERAATAPGPAPSPSPAPGAAPASGGTESPPANPARVTADVVMPGPLPDRHALLSVDLGSGAAWAITGCIVPGVAPCEESGRVVLDEAARLELVALFAEVRAIPRCEPDGIFPDDRPYRLTLDGFPRTYEGSLPGDASRIPVRNAGPCRADARLAWWLVSHFAPDWDGAAAPPPATALPLPDVAES